MTASIKTTTWRNITSIFAKTTSWRTVSAGYVKAGTTGGPFNNGWRLFFSAGSQPSSPVSISQATNGTTYLITLTGTNYTWSPAPASLAYKFQRSTDGSTWSTDMSTGSISNPLVSNTVTYQLTSSDVIANTTNYYRFVVNATTPAGESISGSTTVEGPRNITDLSFSSKTPTSVTLSWTASLYAGRQMVEYKATSSGTWLSFGGYSGTATSATVTGLSSGISYDFRIRPWTGSTNNTGYPGNYSNTLTTSTTSVYTFSFGNTVYVSTNGYITLDQGATNDFIANVTTGRVLGIIPKDMQQNSTTSIWYWSDTSQYTIRWEGVDFGTTTSNIYQATFYSGQSYADVLAITVGGNTPSTTAFQDSGTPTSLYSAGLTTGQARRVYFDGSGVATISLSERSKSTMKQVTGITTGTLDQGYTTITTATNQSAFVTGTIGVSGGSSGSPKYVTTGSSLTITNSGWPAGTTFTYQWYRSRDIEGIGPIALTTSVSQASSVVGENLYCNVSYANSSQGIPTTFFTTTEAYYIVPAAPTYTLTNNTNGTFTISGVSATGGTGYYGTWGGSNAIASSSSPTANGTSTTITSGAGSVSVTLYSSVLTSYQSGLYTQRWSSWESTTNSVTVTSGSAPVNTSIPTLSGGLSVGTTFTFGVGTWSGSPTSYDLRLYRGTPGVIMSETLVKSAGNVTSSTYQIPQSDYDDPNNRKYYRTYASATNAFGTSSFAAGQELGPITAAAGVAPSTPGQPTLTYYSTNDTPTDYGYYATWANSTTGTAPISYYLKCYGGSDGFVSVQYTRGPFTTGASNQYFTLPKTSTFWKVACYATNAYGTSADSTPSNSA